MAQPNGESNSLPSDRAGGQWPSGDHKCTAEFIRRKARQLILRTGLPSSDLEDIEQDLSLHLWQKTAAFDPTRGPWLAFVITVVSHEASKLVRRYRAKKRGNALFNTYCTGALKEGQSPESLVHQSTQNGVDARTGHVRIDDQAHSELSIDIEAITGTLPFEWKAMISLRSIKPMSEVSRDMGIPRTTLNGRIKQIRRRFECKGLRKYFEK